MFSSPVIQVVSIGAVHLDTLAHASAFIHPETSTPANFVSRPGGVATNIARALMRLDVRVHLAGTVGSDAAAISLREQLDRDAIEHSLVCRKGHATGQYLALHNPDGALAAACVDDRVLSEAPADLFDDVLKELLRTTAPDSIWFLDANLPADMLKRLTEIILRQSPDARLVANAVSNAKAIRLAPVLSYLDCLFLNRGEADALTSSSAEKPTDELCQGLSDLGLRRFVLTDGGSETVLFEKSEAITYSPARTPIVDVTGAGDALIAGSLAALVRGYSYKDALPFGMAAAALTLGSAGALSQDLSWDAIGIV